VLTLMFQVGAPIMAKCQPNLVFGNRHGPVGYRAFREGGDLRVCLSFLLV
jgi:hypothetical protein